MEYRIKFNKKLLWDYEIKEDDLEREEVLILYISRFLIMGVLKMSLPYQPNLSKSF